MTSDLDIYRPPGLSQKMHGTNAAIYASMRHNELLEAGGVEGCAVWKRVIKAVEKLEAKEPPASERTH